MSAFQAGERVLLTDSSKRRYLITLEQGASFHFHKGMVAHDLVIGNPEGTTLRSSGGEAVLALRPTLADFVLKMRRGAQVVYPKDLAMIVLLADIYPGAAVVEAGAGSGALTMALLRAAGEKGRVVTYEVREDFAETARRNVQAFMGTAPNSLIRPGNVYEEIEEREVDRVVLDLPEPWRALPQAALALRPGGILAAYLPTVLQIHKLVGALGADPVWGPPGTTETLVRTWHIEGPSARPDHRMIGHTGFITVVRRLAGDPAQTRGSDRDRSEPIDQSEDTSYT